MTSQYEARAASLKQLRTDIGDSAQQLSKTTGSRDHSASMIARFELLEQKYSNDIDRLSATDEGVAFFNALAEVPCPLCGTPTSQQIDPYDLRPGAPTRYREAIAAEVEKIRRLRSGLVTALDVERRRFALFRKRSDDLASHLRALQKKEAAIVNQAQIEFSADPKTLAVRRSELSAQVAIFDEMERLAGEIERLKKSKVRRRIQVDRDGGSHGRAVADLAKSYLHAWGFTDIQNISLDAEQCDLVLNDRPRLSYGAGRRALYLAALIVALMENALSSGHPHLGAVVIDSPLKAYADPAAQDADTVTLATVVDRFYEWLSEWDGRGQIVVLENEKIDPRFALRLGAIEFTGIPGVGRQGFYPWREVSARDDDESESDATDGN